MVIVTVTEAEGRLDSSIWNSAIAVSPGLYDFTRDSCIVYVCCNELQCVAVCFRLLQCVAVCRSELQSAAVTCVVNSAAVVFFRCV